MEKISTKILQLRHEMGWSQDELAKRSKVSRVVIYRVESKMENVRMLTLEKIVSAFGLSLYDFLLEAAKNG